VPEQVVLLVTNILLGLVLNLALLFVARDYPETLRKSQRVWAGAGLWMVFAWLLLGLRAMGASPVSVIAANFALGFGLVEYARALRMFCGASAKIKWSFFFGIVFALVTALLYQLEINRDLRAAVINLLAIGILGYVVLQAKRSISFSPSASKLMMFAVTAFAAILVLRVGYLTANMSLTGIFSAAQSAVDRIVTPQSAPQQLMNAALTACFALLTFSFSIMCKERLTAELHRMVRFDSLTGALNRAPWRAEFNAHFEQGRQFSILLFDIDHFKSVNDQHGHSAGDAVLQSISACARALFGERVGRLGGEEFAVIVRVEAEMQALQAAERFRRAVSHLRIVHGSEILIATISLGVADARHYDSPKDLLKAADDAMYAAKRRGRNISVAATSM
jgi:diguanylate cyclase (GGDEF)-like protein